MMTVAAVEAPETSPILVAETIILQGTNWWMQMILPSRLTGKPTKEWPQGYGLASQKH